MSDETTEQKRERLMVAKREREAKRDAARRDHEIERLELADRFESELGPEGQSFAIYDATSIGEGFFVVKLGEAVLWTKYLDSKMSDADRYDFVSACVVHPSREQHSAARGRRPGIDVELANRLGALFGVKIKVDEGK